MGNPAERPCQAVDRSAIDRARRLAAAGEDDAAKAAYCDYLRADPTHPDALIELGTLAEASGHRTAARTAYEQAVLHQPANALARVALGNWLLEADDPAAARPHFEAALRSAATPAAHQGLARALAALGDEAGAAPHWLPGFAAEPIVRRRYRGPGEGVPVLQLVCARGGNVPTRAWLDDRRYAVTSVCAEFLAIGTPLPRHELIVNAIGDADRSAASLARAASIVAASGAPVLNPPDRVRLTGREETARRLGSVEGVIAPRMQRIGKGERPSGWTLPVLLRAPGFHTGQHFLLVDSKAAWAEADRTLPGHDRLLIEWLDARGGDGRARKFRAMFIGGEVWPLHLAISSDWKVHYFTADMAADAAARAEERRFLEDMAGMLGPRAMRALNEVGAMLGLDYGGIDFAVAPGGSLLLFEANATMVIIPPDADPMWDYRRAPIERALAAARALPGRLRGAA